MGMYCEAYALSPADMQQLLANPDQVQDLIGPDRPATPSVSMEKAWHGLHFLLTGSATEGSQPLAFILHGGEPIGEDLGYGPARLFRPAEVSELNSALAAISGASLWSRFDAEAMTAEGVYPGIWDEPEDELREEYLTYFDELKALVAQASKGGMALLVVLS